MLNGCEDFCCRHDLENQVITVFSNLSSTDCGFCFLAVVADDCMITVVETELIES